MSCGCRNLLAGIPAGLAAPSSAPASSPDVNVTVAPQRVPARRAIPRLVKVTTVAADIVGENLRRVAVEIYASSQNTGRVVVLPYSVGKNDTAIAGSPDFGWPLAASGIWYAPEPGYTGPVQGVSAAGDQYVTVVEYEEL